jgi:hypothetical protein
MSARTLSRPFTKALSTLSIHPPPQSDFWLPILQFGLAVQAELHDHVYAKHRVERPLILLGGVEPSARAVVRVPFDPATDN